MPLNKIIIALAIVIAAFALNRLHKTPSTDTGAILKKLELKPLEIKPIERLEIDTNLALPDVPQINQRELKVLTSEFDFEEESPLDSQEPLIAGGNQEKEVLREDKVGGNFLRLEWGDYQHVVIHVKGTEMRFWCWRGCEEVEDLPVGAPIEIHYREIKTYIPEADEIVLREETTAIIRR